MVGILVDVTRCTGCERCVQACITGNGLDPEAADRDRALARDGLSENRLSTVLPLDGGRFARKACMHCLEPSCVQACLVGGLSKADNGAVVYDPDKCIGCRYCMLACPFHVPRYQWSETVPFVRKCELCTGRLAEGQSPACVEACPEEVLRFGEREELLQLAHRRMEQHPGKYIDHVWGEDEYGGTSVLYISDVDLGVLGWPESEAAPIPELTEPVLMATPYIGGSVLAGVAGINWVIRRRMERMKQSGEPNAAEPEGEEE